MKMNTYELIKNDYMEEAHLHIKRGLELLEKAVDKELCEKIDKYMTLPYTINIKQECMLYYGTVAQLPEIAECGTNYDSAYQGVQRAMIYHFKYAIENNKEIPVP